MAEIKNETQILDRGYNAVRQMAKEMVENGADISDILFHANQVWHEFKCAAMYSGVAAIETGMYIDQFNADATNKLIQQSPRYKLGTDAKRVDAIANRIEAGETVPTPIVKAKKAGR